MTRTQTPTRHSLTTSSFFDAATDLIPAVANARRAGRELLAFMQARQAPAAVPDPRQELARLAEDAADRLAAGDTPGAVFDAYVEAVADRRRAAAEPHLAAQIQPALTGLLGSVRDKETAGIANHPDVPLSWLDGQLQLVLADAREAIARRDFDAVDGLRAAMIGIREAQRDVVEAALRSEADYLEYPSAVTRIGGHVRDISSVWPAWPDLHRATRTVAATGQSELLDPPPWPTERTSEPVRPDYSSVDYLAWAAAQPEGTLWVPSVAEMLAAWASAQEYAEARAEALSAPVHDVPSTPSRVSVTSSTGPTRHRAVHI